jgi:integrase
MAKRIITVTEKWLQTKRPKKRQEWAVRQHPGLRVRVGPSRASFYHYAIVHDSRGKAKTVGYHLGTHPEMTLEQAAAEMAKLKGAGPGGRLVERWTVRAVLADLEKERLAHQKKGHEVAATLRLHALEARPVKATGPFGDWLASKVERVHLTELVRFARVQTRDGSVRRGGLGASRALGKALRVLFTHAQDIGACSVDPAAGLKTGNSTPRATWLSTTEQLAAFFEAVDLRALLAGEEAPSSLSEVVRLSLGFLAVVPVRKEAFRTARWSEVDLDAGTWTVPVERLKAKEERRRAMKPQVVVLPPTALRILKRLRTLTPPGSPWVLTSREPVKPGETVRPISEATQIRCLVRLQEAPARLSLPSRLTVHDLRRTWASHAASDAVGVGPLAVDLVLGHSLAKSGLSSSWPVYVHSKVAAREQAEALAKVDAFYRQAWDHRPAEVRQLGEVHA